LELVELEHQALTAATAVLVRLMVLKRLVVWAHLALPMALQVLEDLVVAAAFLALQALAVLTAVTAAQAPQLVQVYDRECSNPHSQRQGLLMLILGMAAFSTAAATDGTLKTALPELQVAQSQTQLAAGAATLTVDSLVTVVVALFSF
jgi:hypothetical protein